MQPDPVAGAPGALVPLVGVIDRERAIAVEIGQLAAVDLRDHVIHPHRCLVVAFAHLLGAGLAVAGIEIGDEARGAVVVAIQVEAGALGVDHHRVFLLRPQLQQIARHVVGGRLVPVGAQTGNCFVAQAVDFSVLHRRIAEAAERLGAGEQQIALDQVCQAEFRVHLDQRFSACQCVVEAIGLDCLEDALQIGFRPAVGEGGCAAGGKCQQCSDGDDAVAHGHEAGHCRPISSWVISQRPLLRTRRSVLSVEPLKPLER